METPEEALKRQYMALCREFAGGIAPKILPALTDGRFVRAFLDKAPMTSLLERMPVHVVLHPYVGLLGAAV